MHTRELIASRELLWNLTLRELRSRYKRSTLGWAWSILNPISTMVIFTIVFVGFFDAKPPVGNPSGLEVYPLFLLSALLPWNFFVNGMNGCMGVILGNSGLVKKVYFPRELLVLSSVGNLLVTHFIEMGLLTVALLIAGNMVVPWLGPTLVLIALLSIYTIGVGFMLSVLNIYFRDLQHLWGIVTQLWFFLTPIVYSADLVPARFRTVYDLNPMTVFVTAFRDTMYHLRWPSPSQVAYLAGVSFVTLAIGLLVFRKFDARIVEEL